MTKRNLSELIVKQIPIENVQGYENNPRKNDKAVNAVAVSIEKYGFKQPCVVDEDNILIVGHTRYKAALQLGLKTIPCVVATDLTPEEVREYRIMDNKLNELAEWDFEKLGEELAADEERAHSVYFAGRLANYTYINTDQAIELGLNTFEKIKRRHISEYSLDAT